MDDEWLTADEQLTRFRKSIEKILGRFKGSESLSIQGPQYSEEDIFVRDKVPSRTEGISVREPGTDWNNALIGQAQNDGSSANTKETPASMNNISP